MSSTKANNSDTAILSISSKNINSCREIAELMKKNGIPCSITENYSVVYGSQKNKLNNTLSLENGCQLLFGNLNTGKIQNDIWYPLKNKYQLGCAHLHVVGKFKGCVYDFFDKTKCPGIAVPIEADFK